MATATSLRPGPTPADRPETVADLLHRLGNIPARRVRLHPTPGTATERDLIKANEDKLRSATYELVDGTLVEKGMGYEESEIAILIAHYLAGFILPRKLGILTGEAGMMRTTSHVRAPDVAFLSRERFPGGQRPKGPIAPVGPDLAVEVLSKSNTKREIARKVDEYFASGTSLVWIVDPKTRTVVVHTSPAQSTRLEPGATLDGGSVLSGFRLSVAEIFPVEGK
jgi:Uma2 family endonuclease